MKNLHSKSVLITGAALGLGRELVYQLAEFSCRFHLIDIRGAELLSLKEELEKRNLQVQIYQTDLCDFEQVDILIRGIFDAEKIDLVINNAAIVVGGDFEEVSFSHYRKVFDLNILSPIQILLLSLPYLKDRPEAHIVQIASIAGFLGFPGAAGYGSSKWALVGLSEALQLELEKNQSTSSIKMTVVCPSYIDTGMFAGARTPPLIGFINPKKLAKSIVRAIQTERDFLFYPWFLRFVPLLRSLLPSPLWKFLLKTMKVTEGMKTWTGRT